MLYLKKLGKKIRAMMKKNEDHCGCKTVYTPQGLRGPSGPTGTALIDYTVVHPRTRFQGNEMQGESISAGSFSGIIVGHTDIFPVEIDRLGFLEAVEISVETPPAAATGFVIAVFNGAGVFSGTNGNFTINSGDSSAFVKRFGFGWLALAAGQHEVVLRCVADPVTGIPDKLITVYLNIV